MVRILLLLVGALLAVATVHADTPYLPPAPSPVPGLAYDQTYFPDADHDPRIPTPESLLGFPAGDRAAAPEAIVAAIRAWDEASARVELVHYADSYEGRPLHYVLISSPENLERQQEVREGMARLADPRGLRGRERDRLIESLPGVAWLAYSIHGNESSGADAALALIHHLAADRSAATRELLDELVIIIDPDMNPDGRSRFVSGIREFRGTQRNVDDQSLVHTGAWPYGRTNHYLFDLNRDWIYAKHPETRGRIPQISAWRPLLFVDAHEMGAQDTYLFSPAREPHNPHFPPYRNRWGQMFADDQAKAFDRYGYPYYTGEWHDDWYPGYTDAWAALRGAQGILYEQARFAEDGVARRDGVVSYRQAVHHQLISSLANLDTLRRNRERMLRAFAEDRAHVLADDGPYAGQSWVVLPDDNHGRMAVVRDLLRIQGFEAQRIERDARARVTDYFGREHDDYELPAGSLVLPGRQPEARLLAAMFDFDPRMPDAVTTKERERLLREGSTMLYDVTAWNIPMMYGLRVVRVEGRLNARTADENLARNRPYTGLVAADDAIAYAISGADDRAPAAAGRLLERGVQLRANRLDTELDGHALPRGSVVVTRDDNRAVDGWLERLVEVADTLELDVLAIRHGRAPGDLPDLGGREFGLLERPRIALLAGAGTSPLDFGSTWYMLDHRLGVRHSHLDETRIGTMDLRRYNVLVLPDRLGTAPLPSALVDAVGDWVRAGGTLIAVAGSAGQLAGGDNGLLATTLLPDALESLQPFQDALLREWLAVSDPLPANAWDRDAPAGAETPWAGLPALPDADDLQRRDDWQRPFMPSGAIVGARVDTRHWLTAGSDDVLPVLYGRSPVMLTAAPVEAPLRVGVYRERDSENDDNNGPRLAGWAPLPAGQGLDVRMSGLLWPEARERIASSAWLVREPVGRGQVILFAAPPTFRGAHLGATRLLENALMLGPGLGTSQPVRLP